MTRPGPSILHRRTALRSACQGFTLIELLIVVGIISILSAIAVPNFLEAQTRAKVSRMQADMRTIAVALESYAVDWNKYPPRTPATPLSNVLLLGDMNLMVEDMAAITTPVSYLTKVPVDIFETVVAPPNNLINYWDRNILESWESDFPVPPWVLLSVGSDSDVGQGPVDRGNYGYTSNIRHMYFDYDPTNGTISDGNIYRGPGNERGVDVFRSRY